MTVVTDDGEKIEVEVLVDRNPKRDRERDSGKEAAKQPPLVKSKTLSKKQKHKRKKKGSDDDDDSSDDDEGLDEILSSGIVAAVDEDQLREINLIESEVRGVATQKAELIEQKTSFISMLSTIADPRIKRRSQGILSTNESAITQLEEDLAKLEEKKSIALQPKPPPPPPPAQPAPRGALKRPLDREWRRDEPRGRNYRDDPRDRNWDRDRDWNRDQWSRDHRSDDRDRDRDRDYRDDDRHRRRREDSIDREQRR